MHRQEDLLNLKYKSKELTDLEKWITTLIDA